MLKRLLAVCIVLLCCVSARADDDKIITNFPPSTVKTEARSTGKQVLNLPQDENKLYLTLYGDPSDEHYVNLKKWFNENAELRSIRTQCHFSAIDTDSKLFKDRYADEVDAASAPCIRFVTPGGVELLKIEGKYIPMSDMSLTKGIRTGLMKRLFGNDDEQKQEKKRPDEKLKEAIDNKIDNDINLPPVATAIFGPIIHVVVGVVFVLVILGCGALGVVNTIKQAKAQQ